MKNLKKKKVKFLWKSIILPMLVLGLMIVVLYGGLQHFSNMNDEQNRILTEQSIKKAVIQCYANEGLYPTELSYLEGNYYLTIDHDRYFVYYDCWASNVMPEIAVYERGTEE